MGRQLLAWLEQKQQRLAQEDKAEIAASATLQRELDWIRMSPRARQAKGKARLNAYEDLLAQDTKEKIDEVEIFIAPGPRLGDVVVEARQVRKAFGENLLFDDMTFTLPPGGIVGVIGPNGAGKTTLFRMITAQERPDAGSLRLGPRHGQYRRLRPVGSAAGGRHAGAVRRNVLDGDVQPEHAAHRHRTGAGRRCLSGHRDQVLRAFPDDRRGDDQPRRQGLELVGRHRQFLLRLARS